MLLLLRLILNLARVLTWPVWGLLPRLRRRRVEWVSLRLHGNVSMLQTARQTWLRRLLAGLRPRALAVSHVRKLVEQIARDPQVKGVFLQLEGVSAGWATRAALRQQLVALRATGKRLVVYLPEGADQGTLYLASAADTIWSHPRP